MYKGKLFILSGPSGSGKDTVLARVLQADENITLSISSITRQMRVGEVEGEKYHFISREEFELLIKEDALLEYNVFVGNYYGTPKKAVMNALENGKDVILEIDVNGADQIRKKLPEAVSIFIMPPSYEELKRRLTGRGTDSEEVIESRLKSALGEMERAKDYNYIVKNDVLEKAVEDVLHIILSYRLKTERQQNLINEVLGKC